MAVCDYTDGQEIDQVLLVHAVAVRERRDGGEYMRAQLGDRTGSLDVVVFDDLETAAAQLVCDAAVRVEGRYQVHPRFGPQINLRRLSAPEPGSFDPRGLRNGPARPVEQLEADLRRLVSTIQHPHLRLLLERLLGEGSPDWQGYRCAPAAKHYHEAYPHGLLEHSLAVAQAVSAISATFAGIDRDVAVAGALLHDIGKLESYAVDRHTIDLTDLGRLHGEIALGHYRVRRAIEDIEGFPPGVANALTHIILSHHGSLEFGSPVVPCTREATLVHMIDNLGGRLGSFDRLERELPAGERWSRFDRAIGGGAYFGRGGEPVAEPQRRAA